MENAQIRAKNPIKNKRGTSEYRLFPQEYFSGCDMAVYFGNVFIDEITSLEFAIQERKMPLFGYNDYRCRKILHGNRIVNGTFTINFKESAYLYAVLEHIKSGRGNEQFATQDRWPKETIEELYQKYLSGEEDFKNDKEIFETIADYYERALWGGQPTKINKFNFLDSSGKGLVQVRRTTPFFDQGFTITIGYGNNNVAFAARSDGTYLDIYGSAYDPKKYPTKLPIEETVRTINGVYLTGFSQIADMSGNPVQEQYSFIAQDVDNFDEVIS